MRNIGRPSSRLCWYIFGVVSNDRYAQRPVAQGPFGSQSEANTAANKITDFVNDPEILSFRTTQLAVAKSQWKSLQSQKTGQLGIALRPVYRAEGDRDMSRFDRIKESRGID
jgi:hypothetical protein